MAQHAAQASEPELVQENRSLYQRIAALQRTERELLAENQELTRKFNTLKQHHDRRARQWSEGLRQKEAEYGVRIWEMSEQLLDLASTHPHKMPSVLSNGQITSWFDRQDTAWNSWSRAFGHHDADRLSNGLHPLQLKELCDEVKGFVRMTEAGALPGEIVNGGKEAIHTLLNAMLANFICAETIASPFWIFTATALGTLESLGVIAPPKPLPSLPGVGFRMEANSFSDVAPLRPGPCPTPKSPQFPPPLVTSMMPHLGSSASFLGFPMKPDMERLVHMLTDAQEESSIVAAHQWSAQMMRLLANGGFSLKDVADAGQNESRQTFVESRLNYARKLKERFLGGAPRYLLHDQDSSGIELLERMLTGMIDDALRFSCRLWTRVPPLRLHGWEDFGDKGFRCSSQLATLCHMQAPVVACNHKNEKCKGQTSGSPTKNERSVIMVVQPAIVTESIDLPVGKDGPAGESVALIWLRARVMVAGPMAPETEVPPTPAGVGSQPSSQPDTATGKTTSSASASVSGTPKIDTPKSFEVLPAFSYNTKTLADLASQ